MSRSDAARRAARTYASRLRTCLEAVSSREIAAVADHLQRVVLAGGTILIAGNGGSATTASHMALDLGKGTRGRPPRPGARRIRTLSLCEPAVLTAWGNDHGYEHVFAEQVSTLARPGDAVVLLSVSGTSPNIVAAARAARAAGAAVIALVGDPGRELRALADLAVVVPSREYEIVEDTHLAIGHILTVYLKDALDHAGRPPVRRAAVRGAARTRTPRRT